MSVEYKNTAYSKIIKDSLIMNQLKILSEKPTIDDFKKLRNSASWANPTDTEIQTGIENSTYTIIAKDNDKTLGMSRVVGNSNFMFLIADMIVYPEYQGQGIGKKK